MEASSAMDDARNDYQAAVKEYSEAQAIAAQKIKMSSEVSNALNSHLQSFLGWQYNFSMQTSQYDKRAHFDMKQWPDAQALKVALTNTNPHND
jgi:hypothetical protein